MHPKSVNRRQFIFGSAVTAMLAACAPKAVPQPAATEAPAPAATQATAATEAPAATVAAESVPAPDISNTNLEQIKRLSEQKANLRGFGSPLYVAVDVKSFNDQLFDKKMEELTNVHIAWQHAADWGDAPFDLLMASGDQPDLVAGYSVQLVSKYGQKGALTPLNDYIASFPYLQQRIKKQPVIRASLTAPDGNIYAFPRANQPAQQVFGGYFIRKDWLDEVSMPVPTTVDEYYQALKAMKEKDPKRYPLGGYSQSLNYMIWQWGVGSRGPNCYFDFYHDGDAVKFGPIQPQYKEALVYLNQLFKEELIDPEYTSQVDATAWYKRWTDGYIGASYAWLDDMLSIMKIDPKIQLVAMRPPKGPFGHQEEHSNHPVIDYVQSTVIPVSSKNKDIAAEYTDLYYSDSGGILYNWGIFGDTYTEAGGQKQFTDKVTKDSKLTPNEYLWNWVTPLWIGAAYMLDDAFIAVYPPEGQKALEIWRQEPWETVMMPPVILSEDENNMVQQTMTDIVTLVDESIAGLINGTKSLAIDYDTMVANIKSLGIDNITQVYQAAYDRFMAAMKA